MIPFSVYTYHVITLYLDIARVCDYEDADYVKYLVSYSWW